MPLAGPTILGHVAGANGEISVVGAVAVVSVGVATVVVEVDTVVAVIVVLDVVDVADRRRFRFGGGRAGNLRIGDNHAEDGPWRQVRATLFTCGKMLQTLGYCLLLGLLSFQSHLSGHDALSLEDQVTLGTETILEFAVSLVAFEPGYHAVVPAPSALGPARLLLLHTVVAAVVVAV